MVQKMFGNSKWYTDEVNGVDKVRTNEDRRKFRFGLKSAFDFLILQVVFQMGHLLT